jgi:hypothetical protein
MADLLEFKFIENWLSADRPNEHPCSYSSIQASWLRIDHGIERCQGGLYGIKSGAWPGPVWMNLEKPKEFERAVKNFLDKAYKAKT